MESAASAAIGFQIVSMIVVGIILGTSCMYDDVCMYVRVCVYVCMYVCMCA